TDESRATFRYEHRKSANGRLDLPAHARAKRYELRLGNWSVREVAGAHRLRATLGDDLIFEVDLRPMKPAALNGQQGIGVSFKDEGEASRYFSYTRMSARVRISRVGASEGCTG